MQLIILHSGTSYSLEVKEFTDKTQKQGSETYRKAADGEYYHTGFLFPLSAQADLEAWLTRYQAACKAKDDTFGEIYAISNKHRG